MAKGGRFGKYGELKRFERLRQKKKNVLEIPRGPRKTKRDFPRVK
jgi:hypothetical protein